MTHTAVDILMFVLFAASIGFFMGQAWPGRFAFLSRALSAGDRAWNDSGSAQGRRPYGPEVESEKWRRRAARLLAALRHRDRALRARDREVDQLQDQISALHRDRDPESCASSCDPLRKLEDQLHAQSLQYDEAERLRQCKEAELADLRHELVQWNEKWADIGTELSRCAEALAAMEHALAEQAPRADPADDVHPGTDAAAELSRLRAAATEQQRLNAELMKSLQDRRRRILVLETELAVMRGGPPARSSLPASPAMPAVRPQPGPPDHLHPPGAPLHADDLTQIRGIGARVAERLNRLGVFQFEQLAALDEQDILWLEQQDRVIRLRIRRDRWVEQAADLAPSPAALTFAGAPAAIAPTAMGATSTIGSEARAVM
jgi:predicted flap endonuclease-1-like 5' DNA nuclease